jgi:hypothetical protein
MPYRGAIHWDPIMTDNAHSDVMRLPFERAIEELESIVKRLEEQAKADWKLARFDTVPGNDKEFIPPPD